MPHNATRALTGISRRFGALVLAFILAVAAVVVPSVGGHGVTAGAATTSGDGVNFGDCDFRKGSGATEQWANQICWLDLGGLESDGTITKKIGDYTLTATVGVTHLGGSDLVNAPRVITAQSKPAWDKAAFGSAGFFEQDSRAQQKDILRIQGGWARIKLSSIRITDANGSQVSNSRLFLADAEATGAKSPGEWISVSASNGAQKIGSLQSPNSSKTCQSRDGAGREPTNGKEWPSPHTDVMRDYVCWDAKGGDGQRGSFIVAMDNPDWAEIGVGTYNSSQAIALGVALGHTQLPSPKDGATVKSSYEHALTGTDSSATYSAALRQGGKGASEKAFNIPSGGGYVTYFRTLNAAGTPTDQLVYRSTITAHDGSNAFDRYEPEWTCVAKSANAQTSVTLRSGTSGDYTVTNDSATGMSEIATKNSDNRDVSCTVSWEPRFKPGQLNLAKTVDGNAANFAENALSSYTLHYKCTAPAGFTAAYPDVKLEGDMVVQPGAPASVGQLPQASSCTVAEVVPAAGAGTDLTLSWNGATAANPQAPVTVTIPSNSSAPTAIASAQANNNYTYRAGKLDFSKTILGDPVSDGKIGGTYQFRLVCDGTDVRKDFTLDLNQAKPSNSTSVDGIPVGRDCSVTPLSDLTEEQRQTMELVGRKATLNGAGLQPDSSGAYHFTLPDLGKGQSPTATMHFDTSYRYLTFPLVIRKEVNGLAAGNADLNGKQYTVNYRCQADSGKYNKQGDVSVGAGAAASVDDVRAGASCLVWENEPGDTDNTLFKGATVQGTSVGDNAASLSNADARTNPAITIRKVSGTDENRVTVTNTFDPKLGTVDLKKRVNSRVTGKLPDDYTFTFNCGTRNVRTGDAGQSRTAQLTGTATVAADGTVRLKATDGDANDQNGSMGVPYGNTCTFGESTPKVAGGIQFATNVSSVKATVTQPENMATVTNEFTPAGNGLTISLRTGGRATLAPSSLHYQLTCDNGYSDDFDLAPNETMRYTASQVPKGTSCTLTESGEDKTRTTEDGRTYPIDDAAEYLYAADEGESVDTGNPGEFVIGEQSTMDVHHEYNLIQKPLTAAKKVQFNDPNGLISDPRRKIKSERIFPVTIKCVDPDGTDVPQNTSSVQQDSQTVDSSVAIGASCTVAEGDTTTAAGITLSKAIEVNGDHVDAGSTSFKVGDHGANVLFINTYKRRTTSIELEKKAVLPTDAIRTQYANAGKSLQDALYDHTFTLVCKDPETGDTATLQSQESHIKGEGTTHFDGVPVGADCQLTGDKFGSLELNMNDGNDDLKAFLRPAYVDWVVDREGGNAYPDQTLAGDKTTSPTFLTEDDPDENSVRLDNHYEYETSKVTLSKELSGLAGNLDEIPDNYTFNFLAQCKAIGYQTSSPGESSFIPEKLRPQNSYVIPTTLKKSDFKNGAYLSGEATVPAGSLCTFTEQDADNVPAALSITPEQKVVREYAPNPGPEAVQDLHFVNKVERRTTPVRIDVYNSGYLNGANPDGYTAALRCTDPAGTEKTLQFPLAGLGGSEMPRTNDAPSGGQTVNLPVGSQCTLDLTNSPALAARGQLEVTAGQRTPLAQYGQWQGDNAAVTGASLSTLDTAKVTIANKAYTYTFDTAATLPSDQTDLTVAADIYHPRARYDVQFTKTAAGPSSGTFKFSENCGDAPGDFTLEAGKSHTIQGVPVDSQCVVRETDDGNNQATAVFEMTKHGDLITPAAGGAGDVRFTVYPVTDPADTSTSGERWSLTASNTFPGMSVDKSIKGTPLGRATGELFDTMLLPHDAAQMPVTYTVTNTGEYPLTGFAVRDPSLAGMTVSGNSTTATVDQDGAIPADVCARPGTLANGDSFSCSFDVAIPAKQEETWRYPSGSDAAVTVTAKAAAGGVTQTLRARDSQGAYKPSATLSWLLPETGQQTLVWFLILGLLLFGYGAWRVSRRRDDGTTAGAEMSASTGPGPEGGELVDV